jgi:hypothetical protein
MRRGLGLTIGLLGILALPAAAPASETLGMVGDPGICSASVSGTAYVSPSVAAGPDYIANAPGVITSWSSNTDVYSDRTLRFEVLKPDGGTNYTATQKDIVRTLQTPSALNVFTGLHIPINAGDTIGVFVPAGQTTMAGACLDHTGPMADQFESFAGDPPTGTSTAFSAPQGNARLNLAAIVEPDADKDGFGDETQDKCTSQGATQAGCSNTFSVAVKALKKGKAEITATVPGAGSLTAGDSADTTLKALAAKKKKSKALLKQTGASATAAGPVTFTVTPSKKGKAKLKRKGKLKLTLKVVYTPTGGTAGTQTMQLKLKS